MGRKHGQAWMYGLLKICFKLWILLLIASKLAGEIASDVCKQQQQSSFQLKRIGSTSTSKKCAALCCKDTKCHVPLRVKHHCYSVTCAKEDLCQIVYDQLKDFEGHRVDKREVVEEEDEFNWKHDHGEELNVYQKRDTVPSNSPASNDTLLNSTKNGLIGNVFASFLLQEAGNIVTRNARDIGNNSQIGNGDLNSTKAVTSNKLAEENNIYIQLNSSSDQNLNATERLLKRSTDDEGDDDSDGDHSRCLQGDKFEHSTIPQRKKNYHYKQLEKKSKTLSSCSKKCCKTDSCILSFLVEKTCIGIICSGDGDCHTKKDKLPRTKFELTLMKREVIDSSGDGHENSEEKRSTIRKEDDDDDDDDNDDDDDDDDVDGGDEESEEPKKKKKKPKHKKKAHKKKKHHKKSEKKKAKKEHVKKEDSDENEDSDDGDDDDKDVDRDEKKEKHTSHHDKHKVKKARKHKNAGKNEESDDQEDVDDDSKKSKHARRKAHKRKDEGHIDEEESENKHTKRKKRNHKNEEDSENNDEESEKEGSHKKPRHKKRTKLNDSRESKDETEAAENDEGSSDEDGEKSRRNIGDSNKVSLSNEESNRNEKEDEAVDKDKGYRRKASHQLDNSNDSKDEEETSTKKADDDDNARKSSKKSKDEYSDDVQQLVHSQKPKNSTLFDDTIVGDEQLGSNDPDGQEATNSESSDEPASNTRSEDEGGDLIARNMEETAGRADESLKMRKVVYADNEKRNDLMIAHRHYEDVEEVNGADVKEADKEVYDDGDDRPRHHKVSKHFRDDGDRIKYDQDDDEGDDVESRERQRSHPHLRPDSHRVEHGRHYQTDEEMRGVDSRERERHVGEKGRHYIRFDDPHNDSVDTDEEDSKSNVEEGKSHHYIKYHSSNAETSREEEAETEDGAEKYQKDHPKKFKKSTKKTAKKSHSSKSHHKHKSGKDKSKSKQHSSVDKEELLIDKLEHLEEKLENKQKKVLEVRKDKVLQKVESLANSLDKNEVKKVKDKGEVKKHKKKNGNKKVKSHLKKPKNEMEDIANLEKSRNGGSEEFKIPQAAASSNHHEEDGESVSSEAASGSGEVSEAKEDSEKEEKDDSEKIVIPKKKEEKQIHLEPEELTSGSGEATELVPDKEEPEKFVIPKTSRTSKKVKPDKKHDHVHHEHDHRDHDKSHHDHHDHKHKHDPKKHETKKKAKKSKKESRKKIIEHLLDTSGSGSGESEEEDRKLTYEQQHHADQDQWSQRDIVIPYSTRISHGHHQAHQEMPVLNEHILDGLDKMRYEKKDTIARPAEAEVKSDKKNPAKSHSKDKKSKPHKKIEKDKSKTKVKSSKKPKTKASHKSHSKYDIMKEFEKYQQFLKSQEIVSSGESSGEEDVSSGDSTPKVVKKNKKSKHQKKKDSKSKHKHTKKVKKKEVKSKLVSHHSLEVDVSSGDAEVDASSGEAEVVDNSKKHKADHEHKKSHSKSDAKKQINHESKSDVKESSIVKSTSAKENSGDTSKLSNVTKVTEKGGSEYSHIKMFHDRKESSGNEDDVTNSTTNKQKIHSPNETSVVGGSSKEGKDSMAKENKGNSPTAKANQVQQTTAESKANIGTSNATVTNIVSQSDQKNASTVIKKPTSKIVSHNATTAAQKPPAKKDPTTASTTKLSTTPTTKKTTVRTTIATTTPKTTTKPATTTVKTTVKVKKPKFKPTKAVRRLTGTRHHYKPTKRIITTTYIPTLNIMTGDEDVNTGNIESTTVRQRPRVKSYKNTAHKSGKGNKMQNKHQRIKIVAHVEKLPKKYQSTEAPRTRTPVKPTLENPYGLAFTNMPSPPPIARATASPYGPPQPHQLQGQTGSAGTLGDIQLPEPPGDGNIASGPPYYKQQGLPNDVPMNNPFDRGNVQGAPNPPYPLQNGIGPEDDFQRPHEGVDHQTEQPYRNKILSPTVFTPSQFGRVDASRIPLQRPTVNPLVQKFNGRITKQPGEIEDNGRETPRKVIDRILNTPKSTKIAHPPGVKKSPLDVIHDILGKPLKKLPPPTNKPHLRTTTKRIALKNAKKEPKPPLLPNKHPTLPHKKPAAPKRQDNPNRDNPNKDNPSGDHPNKAGQKKEPKHVANRLNDFFNKINKMNPVKTTMKPNNPAPRKNLLHNKISETSAPVAPHQDPGQCRVSETLDNMVLVNGRQSGQFTKMPGYPDVPACVKECCKVPTCDLIFKSGEVCYLVHCKNKEACKTEASKEPTIHTRILLLHKPEAKKQPALPLICAEENAFGISWKATKPGNFATRSCPREAKGIAKRQCKEHARWFTPDFSGCTSEEYTSLHEEAKQLGFTANVKDVVTKLEDITTQTIDNSMVFGGDLVKATSILDGLSKFVMKNRGEKFGFQSLRKFARSASNLLDETNKQEWENADNVLRGPWKVMKALENFGVTAASKIPPANNMQPIVTNNMVMSVAHLSNIKKYVFPNYSMPILKKWTTKRDSIILPASLFKSGVVKVASINYKTLAQFLPHQWSTASHVTFTDGFRVNSKVISSSISPKPNQKINPPVTIILHHLKEVNSARTKCVYWDFTANIKNGGSWSSDGCWVVTSNSTVTVCQCDHLTHFAVLVNLNDEDRISAKEQAKENTFALMWLGIPILVVLSVGAMYTCFAWSKAPRRRHVVVKDGKPRLPDDEVIITNTVKEDYPGSPNRYLYSSYNSPSPSDLEWEHAWDFLTNSEFENWQDSGSLKRKRPRKKRLEIRPPRLLKDRRKRPKEVDATSEYASDGNTSSFSWKHQDDIEWSRDRIKCLGKGIVDISSEVSQPVDSLEEFSDVTSVADSKDNDKCCSSFDAFTPDAISSPRLGYCAEPKYYSFVYKSDSSLRERDGLRMAFNANDGFLPERKALHNSCSSLETLRTLQPTSLNKFKYASTSSLCTIGQRSFARLIERKWNSKLSLSSHSIARSVSSGFLDKTWSSKYASSLSISTLARSLSARTITEDAEYFQSGCESVSEEQGYGTFESSMALSNEIMDMNISAISDSSSRLFNDHVETINDRATRVFDDHVDTINDHTTRVFDDHVDTINDCNSSVINDKITAFGVIDSFSLKNQGDTINDSNTLVFGDHAIIRNSGDINDEDNKLGESSTCVFGDPEDTICDSSSHILSDQGIGDSISRTFSDQSIGDYDPRIFSDQVTLSDGETRIFNDRVSISDCETRISSDPASINDCNSLLFDDQKRSMNDCEFSDENTVNKNIPTYDMNLLTPSKKPTDVTPEECPMEKSSLDTTWIDDCFTDDDFVSRWSQVVNNEIAKVREAIISRTDECRADKSACDVQLSLASPAKDLCVDADDRSIVIDVSKSPKHLMEETLIRRFTDDTNNDVDIEEPADADANLSDEACECPDQPVVKTTRKLGKSSVRREFRSITPPKTRKTKRNMKLSDISLEKPTKSNAVTRSPSKHMRSYIALRQQSRYSDHERGVSGNEEKLKQPKRRKKKISPRTALRKSSVLPTYAESDDSECCRGKDDNCVMKSKDRSITHGDEASLVIADRSNSDVIPANTSYVDLDSTGTSYSGCIQEERELVTNDRGSPTETTPNEDAEFDTHAESGDQIRRCVETSVFGVTLKRWKGQPKLCRIRNMDRSVKKP